MVANDFEPFFDAHPAIDRVFFNGAAAEKNFVRLAGIDRPLRYRRLPSTSPAQTMRYADKLRAWREAISGVTSSGHGGRRCAHGRAFSICAPSDSSVASSNGLPTNWIDVGTPVTVEAPRHDRRRLAGHVEQRLERYARGHHQESRYGAPPLVRTDAGWSCRGARRDRPRRRRRRSTGPVGRLGFPLPGSNSSAAPRTSRRCGRTRASWPPAVPGGATSAHRRRRRGSSAAAPARQSSEVG